MANFEIFSQAESSQWDAIISNSVNGTLFHTWEWLKITEKNTNSKLFPLVFFDNNSSKPFGAIPFFFNHKFGLRMIFSPPIGTTITLGPVICEKGYKQHKFELAYLNFQNHIDGFIKKQGVHYTSILTSPGLLDIRPFEWAGYFVSPAYHYKINLKQGESAIWQSLSSSLRWEFKQAKKRGVRIVENTDISGVEYLHSSVKRRYFDQKLSLRVSLNYLKDLFYAFGNSPSFKIYYAVLDDKVLGATLYTRYKGTVTSLFGGARDKSLDFETSRFIDWEIIVKSISDGLSWYEEFGANTRQLCDSKSKFSPELSIYFQIKKADSVGSYAERVYRAFRT